MGAEKDLAPRRPLSLAAQPRSCMSEKTPSYATPVTNVWAAVCTLALHTQLHKQLRFFLIF